MNVIDSRVYLQKGGSHKMMASLVESLLGVSSVRTDDPGITLGLRAQGGLLKIMDPLFGGSQVI